MLRDWSLSRARTRDRRPARDACDLRPDAIGHSRADLLVAVLRGLR